MTDEMDDLIQAWRQVPRDIADLIADRKDDELAALPGSDRLGYAKVPIGPSLKALEGLIEHISNLVAVSDDHVKREVRLFDSPGAETYTKTVAEIIRGEVDHAAQHLADARRSAGK